MTHDWQTPAGEIARQEILSAYPVSNPDLGAQLDRLARLAADTCNTPVGLVSLVGADEQCFVGKTGVDVSGTPREQSFCALAMHGAGLMVVPNALGDMRFADNPLVTGEPHIRFYAGQPLVSPEGAPLGTLCIIDDKPRDGLSDEQERALFTLSEAVMGLLERARIDSASKDDIARSLSRFTEMEQRFQVLADAMPQLVWSTTSSGSVDFLNRRWCEFTGTTPEDSFGDKWLAFLHPDDLSLADAAWTKAVEDRSDYQIEYRLRHHDGSYRWVLARGLPLKDESGNITRWIGTCTDINEKAEANEQMEMLSQELSHRIKNIFAVIGGLVAMSTRGKPEMTEMAGDLQGRILALGRAHDFVRPHSEQSRIYDDHSSLSGMLMQLLAPYKASSGDRIAIVGEDPSIDDRSATPLALFFHELATNAAKYGALSVPNGSVTIAISRDASDCVLDWREQGGPKVSVPAEMGFGHRLIDLSVTRQLGGTMSLHWYPDGLHARATVPVAALSRGHQSVRQD